MNMQHIIYVSILVLFPHDAYAETTQTEFIPPALGVSVDSMLQMVGGLLLVLFIIGAIAWLLKRFSIFPQAGPGAIKIVASASVGQKERVVIVEVEDARLILGVTPQQINTLHYLSKKSKSEFDSATNESLAKDSFPEKLSKTLDNKYDV